MAQKFYCADCKTVHSDQSGQSHGPAQSQVSGLPFSHVGANLGNLAMAVLPASSATKRNIANVIVSGGDIKDLPAAEQGVIANLVANSNDVKKLSDLAQVYRGRGMNRVYARLMGAARGALGGANKVFQTLFQDLAYEAPDGVYAYLPIRWPSFDKIKGFNVPINTDGEATVENILAYGTKEQLNLLQSWAWWQWDRKNIKDGQDGTGKNSGSGATSDEWIALYAALPIEAPVAFGSGIKNPQNLTALSDIYKAAAEGKESPAWAVKIGIPKFGELSKRAGAISEGLAQVDVLGR